MRQEQYIKSSLTQVNNAATLDIQGLASIAFDLVNTFVGTVVFEYTINGTDWYPLTANVVGSSTTASSATAPGKWTANVAGFLKVRLRCSVFTSGQMDVAIRGIFSGGGASSGGGLSTNDGTFAPVSTLVTVSQEYTRPADTNAYAALDTVADSTSAPTILTFTNLAKANGGSGYITKAQIATDQKTNTARFRLHLFNAAPTAVNDNAAYPTLYANIANRIGTIDFPAMSTEDPTNSTQAAAQSGPGVGNLPLAFICDPAGKNLYGLLETLDAFTPVSGQKITVKLTSDQN